MRYYNTLTWPQNAGNPIYEDVHFKNFKGGILPDPPTTGDRESPVHYNRVSL